MFITNISDMPGVPHLSLVRGTRDRVPELAPLPRHDVDAQPQRPGELCELMYVDLGTSERDRVEVSAAKVGVPSQLWLTVAIEAARSLLQIAATVEVQPVDFAQALDEGAATLGPVQDGEAQSRLTAYARALLSAEPRSGARRIGRLSVRPALAVSVKWSAAAARSHQGLDSWLEDQAVQVKDARLNWEAAAASRGESLTEWMAQAALRRRRSSVLDQTLAV
jgi:uncharacterized protein (DUF1778 family)